MVAADGPGPLSLFLADESATLALGARLAPLLEPGLVITLRGDLGAGKTTLVRGLLRALGFAGRVKSPTYTLVETYNVSRLHFYHFDFYRFQDPREWNEAGFREVAGTEAICLIEWPERARGQLPPVDLDISLAVSNESRTASLAAGSPAGARLLTALSSHFSSP